MCVIRFYIIPLLLLSLSATAAEYDYYTSDKLGPDQHFGSVRTACIAGFSGLEFKEGRRYGTTNGFRCVYDYYTGTTLGETQNGWSYGHKAGCPEGQIYNVEKKQCEPPEPPKDCSDKAGKPTSWSLMRPDLNGLGTVEHVCTDGCRVAIGTSTCGATGDDPPGVCWGLGAFDGQPCAPGDPSSGGSPPPQPDPDNPDIPPTCPPGWSLSGTTCFPNPDPDDPDPNNPDPNNPDPNNPDPNTPNPGGGNGGGDGGGDGGDGGGDGGGNGDGSGDGDGDGGGGTGGGDDDGPDKGPDVTGEECDRILKCEGDAVQCAILRQEKQSRCSAEKNADYESNKGKIESLFQGDKFELGESEIEVPGFVQGASRFLPSSCPPPNSFSTSGRTFTMGYEPLCEIASSFSWLFVAAAAFFAAIYVGKAFGGE